MDILFSAAQDQSPAPLQARRSVVVTVVHPRRLHQDQEVVLLVHVAIQDLVQRVPVLIDLVEDPGQSQTRDPDQDLLNNRVKTVQEKGGLVFV